MVNNKAYIGQSRDILRRWRNHRYISHCDSHKAREYPLYRAIRKYGLENFKFEILEECSESALNERERFWIKQEHPEYNQTAGGDYAPVPQKLSLELVKEIQTALLTLSEKEKPNRVLGEEYHVLKDTIRDINVGRTWYDDTLSYPLRISKFDSHRREKKKRENYQCSSCGMVLKRFRKDSLCSKCREKEKQDRANDKILDRIWTRYMSSLKKEPCFIIGISKDSNEQILFRSIADAARYLIENKMASSTSESGARSHISEALRGKRKSAYGFTWRYL